MEDITISLVINTLNAGEYLADCIASCQWADEIIVVDMHSTDCTREIATAFGAKVFLTEARGYVEPARNFALAQATSDWILLLDADERIKSDRPHIEELIRNCDETTAAIQIRRLNHFGDWTIRDSGWGDDYQVRLLKSGCVTWRDQIHSRPDLSGSLATAPRDCAVYIDHKNFKNIDHFVGKLNLYAAKEPPPATTSDWTIIFREINNEFRNRYTPHADGALSLLLAFQLMQYRLLIHAYNWERTGRFPPNPPKAGSMIELFLKCSTAVDENDFSEPDLDHHSSLELHQKALIRAITERDELRLSLNRQEERVVELSKWGQNLEAQSSARGNRIGELQTEVESLVRWGVNSDRTINQLSSTLAEKEAHIDRISSWGKQVDEDIKTRDKRINELQAEVTKLGSWAHSLDREVLDLKRERAEMISDTETQISTRDLSIAELQAEVAKLGSWGHSLDREVLDLKRERAEMIADTETQISTRDLSIAELQAEVTKLGSWGHSLKIKIVNLQTELETETCARESEQNKHQQTIYRLDEMTQKNIQIEQRLTRTFERLWILPNFVKRRLLR